MIIFDNERAAVVDALNIAIKAMKAEGFRFRLLAKETNPSSRRGLKKSYLQGAARCRDDVKRFQQALERFK